MKEVEYEVRHSQDSDQDEEENNADDSSDDDGSSRGDAHPARHSVHPTQPRDSPEECVPLRDVHKACLAFCIKLMNQTVHNKEYDMALVCGMAGFGVHEQHGFRDPESYPPILSSIVKVGRFMVVQHAEHLAQHSEGEAQYSPSEEAISDDGAGDSGQGSDHSPVAQGGGRGRPPQTSIAVVRRCEGEAHGTRERESRRMVVGFTDIWVEDPLQHHDGRACALAQPAHVRV